MNPWLFTIMFTSQLLDTKATTCRTSWCQDWWWYRDFICGNQSQPGYGGRHTQKRGDNQWTMDISCSCKHLVPLVLTLTLNVINAAEIKTPVNHQVELATFDRNSQNSSLQTGIQLHLSTMCSTATIDSAGRSSLTSCHYLDRSPHLRTSLPPRPTPYIVNGREVSTNTHPYPRHVVRPAMRRP